MSKPIAKKHLEIISKKLSLDLNELEVTKLNRLPKGISYFTWSLGLEIERDYSYQILWRNKTYYCRIVTFASLFVLRTLFFERTEDGFKSID